MEPQDALPRSQEPAAALYPGSDESIPHPRTLHLKIYFNIIVSCTLSFPKRFLLLGFLTKILCVFIISSVRATRPSNLMPLI